MQANISVGAKHDRRKYEMITNNLYAVMREPSSKVRCTLKTFKILEKSVICIPHVTHKQFKKS
ncbi:MAG: hypothetical protein EAZ25_13560 [Oscillatoriales cyanobacterium]|jgi:hypothetical protein|nr:MAG: hypothetical protein EAZ25_13560 [Oscillatoriales cyanobacterium]